MPQRHVAVLRASVATLVATCVALVAVEATLRVGGFEHKIPLAGDAFVNLVPFFHRGVRADGVAVMRTFGGPEFLAEKPRNGFRVFVLGESSVQGVPYPREHAFAAYLQRRLDHALPGRVVEVVNCGVAGVGSWQIRRVAEEVSRYQPDAMLIYAGHNDFIAPEIPPPGWGMQRLVQLRFFQAAVAAGQALRQWRAGRFDEELAVDPYQPFPMRARADGRATLSASERRHIAKRFATNLGAMVSMARAAGAVPMVTSLAQNIRDWEPAASRHRAGLPADRQARFTRLVAIADRLREARRCPRALAAYEAALRIDDRPARAHWGQARCLDRQRRWVEARAAYRRASDLDEVPMGAPSSLNAVVRRTAEETGAVFVDVARRLDDLSPHRLVGDDVFADYVHPNLLGNQRIAAIVAERMRELALPEPAAAWVEGYRDPDPRAILAANRNLAKGEGSSRAFCAFLVKRPVPPVQTGPYR